MSTNAAASIALEVGTSAAQAEVAALRKELLGLRKDLVDLAAMTSGLDLQAGLQRGASTSGSALVQEAKATRDAVGGVLSTKAGEQLSADFASGAKTGISKGLDQVEEEGVRKAKKAVASINGVFDGVKVGIKTTIDPSQFPDLAAQLEKLSANPAGAIQAQKDLEAQKLAIAEQKAIQDQGRLISIAELENERLTKAGQAEIQALGRAQNAAQIADSRLTQAAQSEIQQRGKAMSAAEIEDKRIALAAEREIAAEQAAINAAAVQNAKFSNATLASQVSTLRTALAVSSAPGANASAMFTPEILAQIDQLPRLEAELKNVGAAHKLSADGAAANTLASRANRDAMEDLHSSARGLAGSLGALWVTWGSTIPIVAAAAIGGALVKTFEAGKQVEYQLAFVKGMSEEVVKLNDLLAVTQGSQFTPKEGVEGLRALTQAGLTVKESLGVLPDVLNLAQLGEMSVGEAALTATGAVHAFGLSIADTAHIGDVFAKAAAISNTSVSGIAESMKTASTVADFYSISVEQVGAALATLAKRNIEGTSAGTALSTALRNLYAPTDAARKIMQQLNLQISEGGKLKDFNVLLDELKTKLGGFNDQSRIQILSGITDARAAKAVNSLVTDLDLYKTALNTVSDSTGFLAKAQAELADTAEGALRRLAGETESTFTRVFQQAQPQIVSLIDAMTRLVSSTGFEDFLTKLVNGFSKLGQIIGDHIGLIAVLVGGYAALRLALAAATQFTELAVSAELRLAAAEEATGIAAKAKALAIGVSTEATVANGVAQASNLTSLAGLLGGFSKLLGVLGGIGLAISTVVTLWQLFSSSSSGAASQTDALGTSMDHTTRVIETANIALERQISLRKQIAGGELKATPDDVSANLRNSQERESADRDRLAEVQAKRAALTANPAAFDRSNKLYELGKEQLALETDINAQLTQRDSLNRALMRNAEDSIVNKDGASRDKLSHRGELLADQANGSNKTTQFVQPIQDLVALAKSGGGDIDSLNKKLNEYQELVNKNLSNYVKPDKAAISLQNTEYTKELQAAKAEFETVRQEQQLRLQAGQQRVDANRKAGNITISEEQQIDKVLADNYVDALTGAAQDAMNQISVLHRGDKQVLEAFNIEQEQQRIASEMRISKVRMELAQQAAEQDARNRIIAEGKTFQKDNQQLAGKEINRLDDNDKKFSQRFMSASDQAIAEAALKVFDDYQKKIDNLTASYDALAAQRKDSTNQNDAELAAAQKMISTTIDQRDAIIALTKTRTADLEAQKLSFGAGIDVALSNYARTAEDKSKLAESMFTKGVDGMATELTKFVTTGKADFGSLVQSMIADLIKLQFQQATSGIFGTLLKAIGIGGNSAAGSPGTSFASSAMSDAAMFGNTGGLHEGGIVGGTPTFTRTVDMAHFAGAPRFHTGGIVGGEVPIIAKKGEGVFTPAQMASMSPAGTGDTHHVEINQTYHIDSRSDQATIIRAMQQTKTATLNAVRDSYRRDGQLARTSR